jgi:hypothetical protein
MADRQNDPPNSEDAAAEELYGPDRPHVSPYGSSGSSSPSRPSGVSAHAPRAGDDAAAERRKISAPPALAELPGKDQTRDQDAGALDNLTGMDGAARARSPEPRGTESCPHNPDCRPDPPTAPHDLRPLRSRCGWGHPDLRHILARVARNPNRLRPPPRVCAPAPAKHETLALSHLILSQTGETGLISAPKWTDLYREPRMST